MKEKQMLIGWNTYAGSYSHRCESCEKEFIGRKNQLYCSAKCKARVNNELATKKRHQRQALTLGIEVNINALSRLLGNETERLVTVEQLKANGFDLEAPSQRLFQNDTEGFGYGEYAVLKGQNENQVIITKIKTE